jgi:hypothetical protein
VEQTGFCRGSSDKAPWRHGSGPGFAGFESEVEKAKAAAKSAPESKTASRCSICHEQKQAVLRPVFICDCCVDIHDVREAAPPDDGLDIPTSLRRAPR